jgi:hypothetical protein
MRIAMIRKWMDRPLVSGQAVAYTRNATVGVDQTATGPCCRIQRLRFWSYGDDR